MKKIIGFFKKHKVISAIFLILILAGGYWIYNSSKKNSAEVRYVLASVEKGTIISSVTGSGQVSAINQVDVKPKVSGDISSLNIKVGQEIKAGDTIAKIDSSDAQKAVRDAQTALQTSKLELNQLTSAPDALALLQAETALTDAKKNLENLATPDKSTIQQAESSLADAQDTLTKLKSSQGSSLQDAMNADQKAGDDLQKAYEDSFNTIANAFLDLPTIITDTNNLLYSADIPASEPTIGSEIWNKGAIIDTINYLDRDKIKQLVDSAESNYKIARDKYDRNFEDYKNASRSSDKVTIEALLNETLDTSKAMSDALKSETSVLSYWVDYRSKNNLKIFSKVTAYQSQLNSDTSKINGHVTNILSAQGNIKDGKESIVKADSSLNQLKQSQPLDLASAQRNLQQKTDALAKLKNPQQYDIDSANATVKEKELALAKLKAGATDLDIRAKKIEIQQKQDAITDAQKILADYSISAPFDAVVAAVNSKNGDSVSASTVLATLTTKQEMAEITLNEVDVAKVKEGQKATIAFDAIDGLNITGKVGEIDTIGTVTQGVVTYNVKIVFDTQDDRVKPEMSVSGAIVTDMAQDVLIVPSSSVKSSGGSQYVEVPNETIPANSVTSNGNGIILKNAPRRQTVQIGLTDDSSMEIKDGLKEGDQIIAQTINPSSTNQNQSQQGQGLLQQAAGGAGAGGANRFRGGGG